jgi:hypothetical protein
MEAYGGLRSSLWRSAYGGAISDAEQALNQEPQKHVMEIEPVWNSKRIGSRPGMRGGRSVEKLRKLRLISLFLAGRRLPTLFYNTPELRRTLLHVRNNTAY